MKQGLWFFLSLAVIVLTGMVLFNEPKSLPEDAPIEIKEKIVHLESGDTY